MSSVLVLPAASLIAGIVAGVFLVPDLPGLWVATGAAWIAAFCAMRQGRVGAFACAVCLASSATGAVTGAVLERRARAPPLRSALGAVLAEPIGRRDTVRLVGRISTDATATDYGALFPLDVSEVGVGGRRMAVSGGVRVTVAGAMAPGAAEKWTRGRVVECPAVVRRVARYDDPGVPNFERQQARRGTVLLASVKSAALVSLRASGNPLDEMAARVRWFVRHRLAAVLASDPATAGVVVAILIGDRAGLEDDVEQALQRAGTFHVLAISGGNVALIAGAVAAALAWVPLRPRTRALVSALVVVAQGVVVEGGPSVNRAVATAALYFGARAVDLRGDPWHLLLLVAAGSIVATPATPFDVGAQLTFLATGAILTGVPRLMRVLDAGAGRTGWLRAPAGLAAATTCAEVVLMPVNATVFGRVPLAGLVANFVAVPAMAVVQVLGLALLLPGFLAGPVALVVLPVVRFAVWALVATSKVLGDVWWLSPRVPPPSVPAIALFYAAWLAAWCAARPRQRRLASVIGVATALWIVTGGSAPPSAAVDGLGRGRVAVADSPRLSMTVIDVGQGASALLRLPDGEGVLVDAGGLAGSPFDVGARVVVPAMWSLGVRRLAAAVMTHGDPDHIGGALAVLDAFRTDRLWDGIAVTGHEPSARVRSVAAGHDARVRFVRAGDRLSVSGVDIVALAPAEPTWERRSVRNDDSVVLDVRFGEVSIVIPGDAGTTVERGLAARMAPARRRVLVAGHHGSRMASSVGWISALAPVATIVSCGRDNRYGHPAVDTLARFHAARVDVFRTDEDGAVAVDTDGRDVRISTWSGREVRYPPP